MTNNSIDFKANDSIHTVGAVNGALNPTEAAVSQQNTTATSNDAAIGQRQSPTSEGNDPSSNTINNGHNLKRQSGSVSTSVGRTDDETNARKRSRIENHHSDREAATEQEESSNETETPAMSSSSSTSLKQPDSPGQTHSSSVISVVETWLSRSNLSFHSRTVSPSPIQREVEHEQSRDRRINLFNFCLTGRNSSYRVVLHAMPHQDRVTCFVHCPVRCPRDRLPKIAELFMRLNYHLDLGNLEVDYDDGEMRMRACCDFEGGRLVHSMLRNIVRGSAAYLDRLFPHLMPVLFGNHGEETHNRTLEHAIDTLLRGMQHQGAGTQSNSDSGNTSNGISFSQ